MRKIALLVIIILIIIIGVVIFFYYTLQETYYLSDSIPKSFDSIEIINGNRSKQISDEIQQQDIINYLKGNNRKTKKTSVNDYPYKAEEVIKINIKKEENIYTIYIYKSNNKFYIEPPYNGVYKISDKEYDLIYNII
jgi:hypothetical protein